MTITDTMPEIASSQLQSLFERTRQQFVSKAGALKALKITQMDPLTALGDYKSRYGQIRSSLTRDHGGFSPNRKNGSGRKGERINMDLPPPPAPPRILATEVDLAKQDAQDHLMSMVPLYPEASVETTPLRVTVPPVQGDNLATSLDISIMRGSDKSEIAEIDEQVATNRRVVFFNNPALQVAANTSIRIFGGDSAD